ncbi:hypothetical protein BJ684DRAFT_18025, partial [Piptocephalis cylindrospora]
YHRSFGSWGVGCGGESEEGGGNGGEEKKGERVEKKREGGGEGGGGGGGGGGKMGMVRQRAGDERMVWEKERDVGGAWLLGVQWPGDVLLRGQYGIGPATPPCSLRPSPHLPNEEARRKHLLKPMIPHPVLVPNGIPSHTNTPPNPPTFNPTSAQSQQHAPYSTATVLLSNEIGNQAVDSNQEFCEPMYEANCAVIAPLTGPIKPKKIAYTIKDVCGLFPLDAAITLKDRVTSWVRSPSKTCCSSVIRMSFPWRALVF